ncbi:dicarboxylate/amino acid:cation symporter [Hufsiella ginkgonis]|uniref:Cation:dicarboxylase symporter family transporter n=1 Tax=Hufsiella ginkgonis TaxID=2695274 RepID=A0A7K1XUR4_9SPHI|nr:dicarboxylate/amino acid:cation symporter [Hufsiella ginkgonis]MXV14722.1 cation:dicarboxylase symporter family transporter [Hufsiella ginkgonis]
MARFQFYKSYSSIIWLLTGIAAGSIVGLLFGKKIEVIKPLGDIFLNLLFTAVIPLVFFAVASAIANLDRSNKISRVMGIMTLVFLGTVLISAFLTIVATWVFPIHQTIPNTGLPGEIHTVDNFGDQLTTLLTTSEFFNLLSRKSMLSLLIFSTLTGFACLHAGEGGASFRQFLVSGNEVMKSLVVIIMKLGPLGLGSYFAYQTGVFGPELFGTYARSMALYYGFGIFYFFVFFSLYAFIAGGVDGIKKYWRNNIVPSATAVGTCSSIATVPANLEASKNMGVPPYIANITVPLGATLHKDGSSISSIVKMAVVFGMFGKDFTGADTILIALGITVLVSIVEGGIPNGGYIGELLMISVYGFPPEALPPAMIIGTLVDPLATLLNSTGDTVAAMMITRFSEKRVLPPGD